MLESAAMGNATALHTASPHAARGQWPCRMPKMSGTQHDMAMY